MSVNGHEERKKWVDEYNNSLPKQTYYDSDDEEHTFAIDGIYDSEYMCYVYENVPSPRISFKRLVSKLEQAPLDKLKKIIRVEFYSNMDYYTPKDERVDFRCKRKGVMVEEIRQQISRNTRSENFTKKCEDIDRIYFAN
jgi:hypothetical protein